MSVHRLRGRRGLVAAGLLLTMACARADLVPAAQAQSAAIWPGPDTATPGEMPFGNDDWRASTAALDVSTGTASILSARADVLPADPAGAGLWFFITRLRAQQQGGSFELLQANVKVIQMAETPAPVPLPPAAWLLVTGLLGLAGVRVAGPGLSAPPAAAARDHGGTAQQLAMPAAGARRAVDPGPAAGAQARSAPLGMAAAAA